MTEPQKAQGEQRHEKMSKSRGNVVSPDEVVFGVYELCPGYEFRDPAGRLVDYRQKGVWRSPDGYRTATRFGAAPVFLHCRNNPVPCLLGFSDGRVQTQHSKFASYWTNLLEVHEP
jgi:hypothetical protein